ncbi:MAG: hypothetical protein M0018_06800 [Nitrospiraceae bacterium]|nr:hypothetical protein [Nitrospiraceae bacterium]
MRKSVLLMAVFSLFVFAFCGSALALTAGATYTISFGVVNSSGGVNAASYSTSAAADSNGLVSFSLTGVPDNTSCNFMDVTATNQKTGAVELESIVPCPNPGTTMPLGLSGVTNAQAIALKAAFNAAATDDPILAVFGLAIVQTTGIPTADLKTIAKYAEQGISGPGGFVAFLETNHSSIVNATTLATYRKNIVKDLADPASGYSKLMKDSVDALTGSSAAEDRGKAAAVILGNLIQATHAPTDTGIHAGWIMEATDAMGNIVVPYLMPPSYNGAIWNSSATPNEVQDSIGTGLNKLRVQVEIQKYEDAMTLLGATGADVTQFQTAAYALSNATDAAMEQFNKTAMSNGPMDSNTMDDAQTEMQTLTEDAFNAFQNAIAASDTRITTMISNICTALGNPQMPDPSNPGHNAACITSLADMNTQFGLFKYYTPNGQTNWPLNMVILADWVSNLKDHKGTMTYTRDTASIPASQPYDPGNNMGSCTLAANDFNSCTLAGGWWGGYCDNSLYNNPIDCTDPAKGNSKWHGVCNENNAWNKQNCTAPGVWTTIRTCFGTTPLKDSNGNLVESASCRQNPDPYWIMFAIQEDLWIEQSIMQDKMQATQDMGKQGQFQMGFDKALDGIAGNINGTADGSTAITKNQKKAIMELMQPPQM